ncbi:hypothetical protein [Brevundimonas sp.]|uniref:hypothetical protein n=1 Tax=Brevundimonas sp. TaxID=1871086 RepID=UPI00272D23D4|nr:hypothetical protein [Brevundimonas sp.]
MYVIRLALSVALMLATPFAAAAADAAPEKTIPAAFHGRWERDIDGCANLESNQRIVIDATTISYYEDGDTVVSVTARGFDRIDLVVDYENYDGSERVNRTLSLSDAGETLTFSYADGAQYVNYRCPQGNPHGE